MPSCWTCGSPVAAFQHSCAECSQLAALDTIKGELVDIEVQETAGNVIEFAQLQVLRQSFGEISKGLSKICSAIRWGVNEIRWNLQQQTEILKSIDQTLKTPSETQANEWRMMADTLRERDVLYDAEEFYQKALDANRLDYRIYVGLADVLIRTNRHTEALELLDRSMPHAPQDGDANAEIQDWRSYSLRLQGHILSCMDDYEGAVSKVTESLERSPKYHEAQFDLAQYRAALGHPGFLTNLVDAIHGHPVYWYLARRNRLLRKMKAPVQGLLISLLDDAKRDAHASINELTQSVERAFLDVRRSSVETEEMLKKRRWPGPSSFEKQRCRDSLATFMSSHDAATHEIAAKHKAIESADYGDLLQNTFIEDDIPAVNDVVAKRDEVLAENQRLLDSIKERRGWLYTLVLFVFFTLIGWLIAFL